MSLIVLGGSLAKGPQFTPEINKTIIALNIFIKFVFMGTGTVVQSSLILIQCYSWNRYHDVSKITWTIT